MRGFLRISGASALAFHACAILVAADGHPLSTARIAGIFGVSRDHLSKVLQRLARSGMVSAIRGPAGGFVLVVDPSKISLREILESIEGPVKPMGCLLRKSACDRCCMLGSCLTKIDEQVADTLSKEMLSDVSDKLMKALKKSGVTAKSLQE